MTKEDKFKIALFYYKKHGSMVHYGKIFDDEGHIKPNVNLSLIEECIKTDPYIGAGTGCSCDTCIHCQSDFCSLFDKKYIHPCQIMKKLSKSAKILDIRQKMLCMRAMILILLVNGTKLVPGSLELMISFLMKKSLPNLPTTITKKDLKLRAMSWMLFSRKLSLFTMTNLLIRRKNKLR